jgi:hypothetical protein
LAVERHDVGDVAVEPQRDDPGASGIDEPQAHARVGAHRELGDRGSIGQDLKRAGIFWLRLRHGPVVENQDVLPIDRRRWRLLNDERPI